MHKFRSIKTWFDKTNNSPATTRDPSGLMSVVRTNPSGQHSPDLHPSEQFWNELKH